MATTRISKTETCVERIAFGVRDRFGREIGVNVITYEAEYAESGENYGFSHAPGRYFVACCQASRNGENYGSSQGDRHCLTVAERNAYVARRVADSRKQASKKATA